MKKFLLILLAVLMLCSCNVQEEPVPEEPQISESSASETEKPEKIPEKTEDEIYYESLDNEGKNMYSHIDKKNIPSFELHKNCGFRLISDSARYIDGTVTQNSYTMCYDL